MRFENVKKNPSSYQILCKKMNPIDNLINKQADATKQAKELFSNSDKPQIDIQAEIQKLKDEWKKLESDIALSAWRVEKIKTSNENLQISSSLRIQLKRMWVIVPDNMLHKELFNFAKQTLYEQLDKELNRIDAWKAQAIEKVLRDTKGELEWLKTGTLISISNLLHQNKNDGQSISVDNKIKIPQLILIDYYKTT